MFSSPLWGFFYLIVTVDTDGYVTIVLVPSLGILLFNNAEDYICPPVQSSRPLSGDSFI